MLVLKLRFSKMVTFWNEEEGAGFTIDGKRDDSAWHIDVSHLDTEIKYEEGVTCEETLINHLTKNLALPNGWLTAHQLSIMDDGRLGLTFIEDGDANIITADKYEGQGYICDYDCMVEMHKVAVPEKTELYQLFPNVERGY